MPANVRAVIKKDGEAEETFESHCGLLLSTVFLGAGKVQKFRKSIRGVPLSRGADGEFVFQFPGETLTLFFHSPEAATTFEAQVHGVNNKKKLSPGPTQDAVNLLTAVTSPRRTQLDQPRRKSVGHSQTHRGDFMDEFESLSARDTLHVGRSRTMGATARRLDDRSPGPNKQLFPHGEDKEAQNPAERTPETRPVNQETSVDAAEYERKRKSLESRVVITDKTPEKRARFHTYSMHVASRRAPVVTRSTIYMEQRKRNIPQSSSHYQRYQTQTFGLKNLGNTCYLNAVMQALCSLREFVGDLRNMPEVVPTCSKGDLFQSTVDILGQMSVATASSGPLSPDRLRERIALASPMFATADQQDAHEFLLEYVNQLHDELLAARIKWLETAVGADAEEKATLTTQAFMDSEIQKRLVCEECGESREVSEHFRAHSLDIRPGSACSLNNMLSGYLASESVVATCDHCKGKTARMEQRLALAPRVLVLHVKRFVPNLERRCYDKQNATIEVPSRLCLSSLLREVGGWGEKLMPCTLQTSAPQKDVIAPRLPARPLAVSNGITEVSTRPLTVSETSSMDAVATPTFVEKVDAAAAAGGAEPLAPDLQYELRSVVAHEGSSPHSGHYVCYAKAETGVWRLYDDTQVRDFPQGQEPPQRELGQKAYILFYVLRGQVV